MPKLSPNQVPAYRLHKESDQAIVTLGGRDFLLGAHGSLLLARFGRTMESHANARGFSVKGTCTRPPMVQHGRVRQPGKGGGTPGPEQEHVIPDPLRSRTTLHFTLDSRRRTPECGNWRTGNHGPARWPRRGRESKPLGHSHQVGEQLGLHLVEVQRDDIDSTISLVLTIALA
jgi:hypothetical protein